MNDFFKKNKLWGIPVIAMILLAPFTPALDLALSRHFFHDHDGFVINPFFTFAFDYGPLPAQVVCGCALVILFLSFFSRSWKSWRSPALVLVLTMAIGSGLIVHAILKDHWGRPRPKQILEFGGSQSFRPFYQPNFFNQPEPSKSFVCGHCSMGFYFFALALIARRYRLRFLFLFSIFLAFSLGFWLSLTRIAQGGHFFSDTLMSALIMWLTAYFCEWLVYLSLNKQENLHERIDKTSTRNF